MVITRAPLRISLAGGGTDLPSYYERFTGITVAMAINKYVYTILKEIPTRRYEVTIIGNGVEHETAATLSEMHNQWIRAAFRRFDVGPGISITILSQVPYGTGLGSSGAFLVSILKAIHTHQGNDYSPAEIAEQAFELEVHTLGRPVGKQDQYAAAYGAVSITYYGSQGNVTPTLVLPNPDLFSKFALYYTHKRRDAALVLRDQESKSKNNDEDMFNNLHQIKQIAHCFELALHTNDVRFANDIPNLINKHWNIKKARTKGMSDPYLDKVYNTALNNGASAGKLVGAGAGGFFLFYVTEAEKLNRALNALGLTHLPFSIDYDGVTIVESIDEHTNLFE